MSQLESAIRPGGQESDAAIRSSLLRLAAPLVGMTITRFLMGFIDFAMVSWLGTTEQAAISPATMVAFVIGCVAMGITTAVQAFVSQADGRGERYVAGAYAWQSLYIALIFGAIGVPLGLTTEYWFGPIAALGKHTPQVAELEIAYIQISMLFLAPVIASIGLNGFFMGIQRPGVALTATLVALVINAFANWVLIFGNLGFPKLGVAGAAIATSLGWMIRSGIMLVVSNDAEYHTRRSWRWDWKRMRDLVSIGAPTSVQWLLDLGSWVVFMIFIIPPFGEAAMAATNIAMQYMHMSFMPAIGIGMAVCSKVGFCIGERQPNQAHRYAHTGFRMVAVYMSAVGLVFLFAREPLIWLFNKETAVVSVGGAIMIWVAVFQFFDAMCIVYSNALRGAGDTRVPAIFSSLSCWIIFIGGGVAMAYGARGFGIAGPWTMCAMNIIVLGLLFRARWNSNRWQRIKLFDHEPVSGSATPGQPVVLAQTDSAEMAVPHDSTELEPAAVK
ncbi:MAG: MATE family efflux transporter [Phycisphaerales bacterium]|nr:MATE family efflux transporter [Phycisphaerales bacterium]